MHFDITYNVLIPHLHYKQELSKPCKYIFHFLDLQYINYKTETEMPIIFSSVKNLQKSHADKKLVVL